ncbi:MAG: carboxymuconolactone decarboxylase family protein [Pseudomonadota bacterium]
MHRSWPSANKPPTSFLAEYRADVPELSASFAELPKATIKPGALDPKTHVQMALAIGIAVRCDVCIGLGTEDAIHCGAVQKECEGTIGIVVFTSNSSSFAHGAQVLGAFHQLSDEA